MLVVPDFVCDKNRTRRSGQLARSTGAAAVSDGDADDYVSSNRKIIGPILQRQLENDENIECCCFAAFFSFFMTCKLLLRHFPKGQNGRVNYFFVIKKYVPNTRISSTGAVLYFLYIIKANCFQ